MNNLKKNCEELLITEKEDLPYSLENVRDKKLLKIHSRKERIKISKEKKMMDIIENTIILSPDWFYTKRKKIIIFGLQLDLESIIIGVFIGIICINIKLIYI